MRLGQEYDVTPLTPTPRAIILCRPWRFGQISLQAGEPVRAIQPVAPEAGTWHAFLRAIETRQPTLTSSGDNINTLELLFAAIESASTGRLIKLR